MQSVPTVVPLISRILRLSYIHANETGLKIRFGKVARNVDEQTTLAMLAPEECDFDQYTPGGYTPTWTTGIVDAEGNAINETGMISVVVSTVVVTNTIHTVWIDNGAYVLFAATLANPVPMAVVGQAFKIALDDSYPPGVPSIQVYP